LEENKKLSELTTAKKRAKRLKRKQKLKQKKIKPNKSDNNQVDNSNESDSDNESSDDSKDRKCETRHQKVHTSSLESEIKNETIDIQFEKVIKKENLNIESKNCLEPNNCGKMIDELKKKIEINDKCMDEIDDIKKVVIN
jgi:hypothetical protein